MGFNIKTLGGHKHSVHTRYQDPISNTVWLHERLAKKAERAGGSGRGFCLPEELPQGSTLPLPQPRGRVGPRHLRNLSMHGVPTLVPEWGRIEKCTSTKCDPISKASSVWGSNAMQHLYPELPGSSTPTSWPRTLPRFPPLELLGVPRGALLLCKTTFLTSFKCPLCTKRLSTPTALITLVNPGSIPSKRRRRCW